MKSFKEQRIRKITQLYYSRLDVQNAIFEFSKNREIVPRYFDGFGKRPDSLQYKGDIFELVKKGATSFNCSEELWQDPLKIETGMDSSELDKLRIGWDLVLDVDCKWFDYSKLATQAIVKTLELHGVKNIGVKFSGSKGFHIIVPWKAFPKEINGIATEKMFPEIPRKLAGYIAYYSEKILKETLPENFYKQFKDVKINRGYRCKNCGAIAKETKEVEFHCENCEITEIKKFSGEQEIPKEKCYQCKKEMESKILNKNLSCPKCNQWQEGFEEVVQIDLFELIGLDIGLVSPRHLFRMPYSLHEKTALASAVIDPHKIQEFEMKNADPMKIKIKNFMPNTEENEARELLIQALDWSKENEIRTGNSKEKIQGKYADFKPIELKNLTDQNFPPCILEILKGLSDGQNRSLFVLINLFRSVGMDKEELEKRIYDWNKKNNPPLKLGIIKSQLSWSYRKKPIMPPNCKEFYQNLGVCIPDNLCNSIKNPVNYIVRKNFSLNKPLGSSKITNFKKMN